MVGRTDGDGVGLGDFVDVGVAVGSTVGSTVGSRVGSAVDVAWGVGVDVGSGSGGGGGTGARGVTALEATEGLEFPAALVATTVNV